jgi:hypothetical protein
VVAPVGSLPVDSRRHAAMPAVQGDQIRPSIGGWWRLRATWEAVGDSDAPLPPPDLAVAGSNSGVTVMH